VSGAARAVVGAARAVAGVLGELANQGATIRTVPLAVAAGPGGARVPGRRETDGRPGRPAWLADAAKTARSPWVVPWQAGRDYPESYLLDLACARECSQADAVGHAGAAYAFTTSLEPVLARRGFFASAGTTHGLRLFSVS